MLSNASIVKFSQKILYQESFRIFNEHGMRLLLSNDIKYTRQYEEILEYERMKLEG